MQGSRQEPVLSDHGQLLRAARADPRGRGFYSRSAPLLSISSCACCLRDFTRARAFVLALAFFLSLHLSLRVPCPVWHFERGDGCVSACARTALQHGNKDYEAVEAIDLALLNQHLVQLFRGEEIVLPQSATREGERNLATHHTI